MKLKKLLSSVCSIATAASIMVATESAFPLGVSASETADVNIRIFIDQAMCHNFHDYLNSSDITYGTYGVPTSFTTRLNNIIGFANGFYTYQGITIKCITTDATPPQNSPFTQCAQGLYNSSGLTYAESILASCTCKGTSEDPDGENACFNGDLHHNNIQSFINSAPYYDSNNEYMAYITVAQLCTNNRGYHHYVYGSTSNSNKTIVMRDTDYCRSHTNIGNACAYARKTFVHEVGHIFGIVDHYNTKTNTIKDDCIWGFNHNSPSVVANCAICPSCIYTLQNYE